MKWNRSFAGAAALAACGWLATATVFTQGSNASAQLRAAMHRETVQGDLNGAITEYRRIADGSADRAVQAQALLRLGAAYEKLGRPEARATYERVVRSYADQPKVATAAKARLAKVGGGAAGVKKAQADTTPRRVAEGHEASLFDITPDGRLALGVVLRGYGGDTVLRDLTTGASRVIVPGGGGPSGPGPRWMPRISDDGSQVAYNWTEGDSKSIRVISTQPGATPRTVVSRTDVDFAPLDWAPDGRSILAAVGPRDSYDLAWIDVNSGALRTIRHFERWREWSGNAPRVSPDGRYVALLATADATSNDTYVLLIDTEGQQATTVVSTGGMRRSLMWTPDSGHLLYVEGTNVRGDLWAVPVRSGQRTGDPVLLQHDFDGASLGSRAIGISANGTLLTGRRVGGEVQIYVTDRRPAAGAPVSVINGLAESWSKDGRSLAYLRQIGDKWTLTVRDITSGQERTYPHPSLRVQPPVWRDDGNALVVVTSRGQNPDPLADQVVQQVDLRTGTYSELFARMADGYLRTSNGALSPDGRTMYMARMNEARTAIADLVARDLTTGTERVLTAIDAGPSRDPDAGIALSPDGRTVAVTVWHTVREQARLFTIGVDGTGRRDLVSSFPTSWITHNLSWNPDGQSLVFLAVDAQRNWRLMRVSATGGSPEPDGLDHETLGSLLDGIRLLPGNFNSFSLNADGTKIAASTLTMPKTEVWALDVMALLAQKP